MSVTPFTDLNALAIHLRHELANKKFILLSAFLLKHQFDLPALLNETPSPVPAPTS